MAHQQDVCPECNECGSLVYIRRLQDPENLSSIVGERWQCQNCKAEGIEWYQLVFESHEITKHKDNHHATS